MLVFHGRKAAQTLPFCGTRSCGSCFRVQGFGILLQGFECSTAESRFSVSRAGLQDHVLDGGSEVGIEFIRKMIARAADTGHSDEHNA